MLKVVICAIFC